MVKVLFFFIFLCSKTLCSIISFEEGMEKDYHPSFYVNSARFKASYDHANYTLVDPYIPSKIPKIIHQIWLGGNVPDKFLPLMESWKKFHPDWQYILWTDSDMDDFPFTDRKAFDKAKNFGSKADILRYEILYRFGGVYVDVDFECIKPLDPLVHAHRFFAGIAGYDYIGNALIGAEPGLILFKKLNQIMNQWSDDQLCAPWIHTGPLTFTRHVYHFIRSHPQGVCIYPTLFFHPFPNQFRFEYWNSHLERSFIESFFIPETFAVHYWAESWNK